MENKLDANDMFESVFWLKDKKKYKHIFFIFRLGLELMDGVKRAGGASVITLQLVPRKRFISIRLIEKYLHFIYAVPRDSYRKLVQ